MRLLPITNYKLRIFNYELRVIGLGALVLIDFLTMKKDVILSVAKEIAIGE